MTQATAVPAPHDQQGIIAAVAAIGLVVDGLTVRFGGLTALSNVSLSVGDSEIVGVIGPNGAGKTTLFNAICGLVRPASGSISYAGTRLDSRPAHRLAGLGIARTLQGLGLWPALTALENVMTGAHSLVRAGIVPALLGLPHSSRDEARLRQRSMHTLERLGVAECALRLPGELPYALQKRVALARALIIEPRLLLLDEPASGLSLEEMGSLRALLQDLRSRTGVLLVEHHMDFVMEVCDRLVVLNFGEVIATGLPAAVRKDAVVIEAYLGVASGGADPTAAADA